MELVTFLLFSTLEVLAAFVFMMVIFRENPLDYIWHLLIISVFMGLQSYFLREIDLGFLAVVINLLFYVILLAAIVRIPLVGAALISAIGFFTYGVVQGVLFNFIGGQLLQIVSSILFFVVSYVMYKFGFGFSEKYKLLRFRWEKLMVAGIIIGTFILIAMIMYQREIWVNIAFFGTGLGLCLIYALRRERGI